MIGSRLLHYDVTAHLGSGGFGDVYQATDTKLGRTVAIKLLPEVFARDSERVARFRREARVLASLNHTNIAAIYGFEESDGRSFLVMEFVPGETPAERIKRGPIPLAEALAIATQIAEALEAAHESEKTIVHRDLKPVNIKITPDGKVKVLDFGLAKAYAPDPSDVSLSNSPTLSAMATQKGVILGTAAYMSPEQAKGREADRRADIFAFGAVLYEMLTGRGAFNGEDVQDILSRVLQREPDWTLLPPDVPPSIHKLLRLCLQKDRKKRRQTATDVRLDLEEALAEPVVATMPVAAPARQGTRLAWIVAAALAVVAVVLAIPAVLHLRKTPPPSPPELRLQINTPGTFLPLHFALSPDGRNIAFVARGDGGPERLWLRPLDKADAQPMPGTEGAQFPFWSPSIGFFASAKVYRIDIAGGPPQVLANASSGRGGSWNRAGVIVFAPTNSSALMRIAASGGKPVALTKVDVQASAAIESRTFCSMAGIFSSTRWVARREEEFTWDPSTAGNQNDWRRTIRLRPIWRQTAWHLCGRGRWWRGGWMWSEGN
jgi:serine/threonine protein kinase